MKAGEWIGISLAVSLGLALGLIAYTFHYAKGSSYLTNDPAACMNCHVMKEQYDGWSRSSHRTAATCNSCHAPSGFVGKYVSKAENGFWHSFAFTTGRFKDHIRIKPRNLAIVEQSCRNCHQGVIHSIEPGGREPSQRLSCVNCHSGVGHMK